MKQRTIHALLLASGVSVSATLALWVRSNDSSRGSYKKQHLQLSERSKTGVLLATSAPSSLQALASNQEKEKQSLRNHKTPADKYFAEHGALPKPATMHASLPEYPVDDDNDDSEITSRKNILVIGDVHGCLEELHLLHEKAREANDNAPFQYVILVGDLCNKGPYSAKVVQFVRHQKRWLAVRGNHDNAALAAALGDPERRTKTKYQWVTDPLQNGNETYLSDEDVMWLAELPYTLRIPKQLLGDTVDTVIVHAGLVPGVPLEKQSIDTMINLRELSKHQSSGDYIISPKHNSGLDTDADELGDPEPWASVWTDGFKVIFGHDARRGFQRYDGDWAIGLDTGACYGKQLTGVILPEKRIVQVESLNAYSPITRE